MQIETKILRRTRRGEKRIIALFSYRYDVHLVPDLIRNIAPSVHGYVALDDRDAGVRFSSEPKRRFALLDAARSLGADWILIIDPDERVDRRLAKMIPKMTSGPQNIIWSFRIREMFTPQAYRDDGLWGAKTRNTLFPIAAVSDFDMQELHGAWIRRSTAFEQRNADLDVYHLRMATQERRRQRRLTYAAVDPERYMQLLGYDYLDDERGMVLKTLPHDRGFEPPFVEDGGLWAMSAAPAARIVPDHDRARLIYVERMRTQRGGNAALHAMRDLLGGKRGDTDLSELSARLALEAGQPELAIEITNATLAAEPDQAHALVTQALAMMMTGRDHDAAASLERALDTVPESTWLRHLAAASQRGRDALTDPDAAWRRWAKGDARLHEGAKVGHGDLAIIVIGYRAQPELIHAVESALLQGEDAEVVVVNSGGGPMRQLLAPYLDRIRLIEVQDRLRVGAARNIGIDASRARFVSFLAGDCRALPGWAAGRLRRHRAGAMAVASAVVAEEPRNLSSAASAFIYHRTRHPRTPPDDARRYGLSTARVLVAMVGYFPPDTFLGEDSAFNALVSRIFPLEWAPDVAMTHRYPTTPLGLLRDHMRRGMRNPLHIKHVAELPWPDFVAKMRNQLNTGLTDARDAVRDWGGFDPIRLRLIYRLQRAANRANERGILRGARNLALALDLMKQARSAIENDPAMAVAQARSAVQLAPQYWRLHVDLADILLIDDPLEHLEEAIGVLQAAHGLAPGAEPPATRLHQVLMEQNRPAQALSEAERAVILAPTVRLHHVHAAKAARALGNLALARLHAHAGLVAAAYHLQPHILLKDLYTDLGREDLAKARTAMSRDFSKRHASRTAHLAKSAAPGKTSP